MPSEWTPLSEAEIAAITALADTATLGPWHTRRYDGDAWWIDGAIDGADGETLTWTNDDPNGADPLFIAAAREAVPRLLATLAARDAEIERLRKWLTCIAEDIHYYPATGEGDYFQGLAKDALNGEAAP